MADIKTIDVKALDKVEAVKDGDTMLIVRTNSDGTQQCNRADATQFKGEDAYDAAKKNGFEGTYEEWQQTIVPPPVLD